MEGGKVTKWGEDLVCFLFFFHFSKPLKFVLGLPNGNFLPGNSISHQEKKSGKMTLPPLKNIPLMPLLDLDWKDHPTREEIYGSLPKVSKVVRETCLNFAAHCSRRQNEPVSEPVFWMPAQGTCAQGRQRLMYPKLLSQDIGLEPQELLNFMQDRAMWRKFIMASDWGQQK